MLKRIISLVCLSFAVTALWSQTKKYHYLGWYNFKDLAGKSFLSDPLTLDLFSDSYVLEMDVTGSNADDINKFFGTEKKIVNEYGLDLFYEKGSYKIKEENDISFITFNEDHNKPPVIKNAAILYNDELCYLFNENGFLFENQTEMKASCWSPVRAVSTSSFLKEKNTVYDGSSLIEYEKIIPWVEGSAGYGIGEWIEFEFYYTEEIYGFIISNGFVSYEKPYLFRQNTRLKTVAIETDQGTLSQEIVIDDKCQLQKIRFDKPVTAKRMRLIIKSVYPGEKWKDTCLSRIVFFRGTVD